MKTRSHKYYALIACGLLLMEITAARLLWVRHQQRQQAIALQTLKQAQRRQTAAQVQAERLAALNALQDSIKTQNHLREKEDLNSALSEAASKGQLDRARQLLRQGASVDLDDFEDRDQYPLLCAIRAHHSAMVRLLLIHGAPTDFFMGPTTPLIFAAEQGDNAIVKLLLAHGAEVDFADTNGRMVPALVIAAEKGHVNVVRTLVKAGAEINSEYFNGTVMSSAVLSGHKAVVACLLAHGGHVDMIENGREKMNRTPLMDAAETGNLAIIRLLLRYGADMNHCSRFEGSALTIAAAHGNKDAVALLLRHEASVRVVNASEQSKCMEDASEEFYNVISETETKLASFS